MKAEGERAMANESHRRKKTRKQRIPVRDISAAAESRSVQIGGQRLLYDFYANLSPEDIARAEHVQPVLRVGQIRPFSDPDPAEADWFAREVRRWCHDGPPV